MSVYPDQDWGPKLYVPDDMSVTADFGFWAPERDPQLSNTFLAWANALRDAKGWWWTGDIPLSSLTKDPYASNIRLKTFKYTKRVNWGGISPDDKISFLADIGGTQISKDLERTDNGVDVVRVYTFDPPLKLSPYNTVKFGLYQYAKARSPGDYIEQRLWDYSVSGLYDTPTPPVARKLTVKVYDSAEAKPIEGALAELLSGETVVDRKSTDGDGIAVLNAFNRTYQLRVFARNYVKYPFLADIDLSKGDASLNVPLSYVPPLPFELPWWWWTIPVAAGGIAVLYVVRGFIPGIRREPPPVIVVK